MFPRELPVAGLPLAVTEQDHQLRGAFFFERGCCLLVSCQHMQKKTGGGGRSISKTSQYRRFWPA
jgi:hypothetical protein